MCIIRSVVVDDFPSSITKVFDVLGVNREGSLET